MIPLRSHGGKKAGHPGNWREDAAILMGIPAGGEEILSIMWEEVGPKMKFGFVKASAIKVTCVPRDNTLVRQYFPDLGELPWKPELPSSTFAPLG